VETPLGDRELEEETMDMSNASLPDFPNFQVDDGELLRWSDLVQGTQSWRNKTLEHFFLMFVDGEWHKVKVRSDNPVWRESIPLFSSQ
jgi:hypothetical protein